LNNLFQAIEKLKWSWRRIDRVGARRIIANRSQFQQTRVVVRIESEAITWILTQKTNT
jgi:hypothetical protein